MAQLMQVFLIKIIDRRIAKFSSKNSPLKPVITFKEPRNVKLEPISSKSSQSTSSPQQKNRPLRVKPSKTFKSDEFSIDSVNKELPSLDSCQSSFIRLPKDPEYNSGIITDPNDSKNFETCKSLLSNFKPELRDYEINNEEISNADGSEKIEEFKEEILEEEMKQIKKAEESAITIQKSWKMFKACKTFKKTKIATRIIQNYFKHVCLVRKKYLWILKIVRVLQALIRKRLSDKQQAAILIQSFYKGQKTYKQYQRDKEIRQMDKKNSAATLIQKIFKGRTIYKKYKNEIANRMKIKNHKKMLDKQATLKKERLLKKQAVAAIEEAWLIYQNKKKMIEVRRYLWTLPYECRLLYFKFQQVKQDADNLKNDVDFLIAKKQGKLPG